MQNVFAVLACALIIIAYLAIGVTLFGWKHGGGIIPLLILLAALRATWRAMAKNGKSE